MTEGSGFCMTAPSPSPQEKTLGRTEGPSRPGLLGGRAGGAGAGSRSTGRSEGLCSLALSGARTVGARFLTCRAHGQPGEAEVCPRAPSHVRGPLKKI